MRALRGCPEHPTVSGPQWDVFASTPDGATEWNLTDPAHDRGRSAHNQQYPTVSPDGSKVAWVDYYRDGLFVTEVASGTTSRLVSGMSVSDPAWAPGGDRIAFTGSPSSEPPLDARSLEEELETRPSLYTVTLDGSAPTEFVRNGEKAVWSPDGNTIAFLRNDFDIVRDRDRGTTTYTSTPVRQSLWFVSPDGSDARRVDVRPDDADWGVNQGAWSPDGTRFAVEVSFGGNHDIVIVEMETRTGFRLTEHPAVDASPSWAPDGSTIAFATGRWGAGSGRTEIATIGASGDGLRRVTNNCWDDRSPTWVAQDSIIRSLEPWSPPDPPDPPEGAVDLFGEGASWYCDVEELAADPAGLGRSGHVWIASPTVADGSRCPGSEHREQRLILDVDGDARPDLTYSPLRCRDRCFTLAAVDIDRDGDDEIFVADGPLGRLSSARVGIFVLARSHGRLLPERVSLSSGGETFDIVTAPSQLMEGAYCHGGRFHIWSAPTRDAGATYDLVDRAYRLDGSRLERVGEERSVVEGREALPPDPASTICGVPISIG
jgi:Tol biopolymer transport system component